MLFLHMAAAIPAQAAGKGHLILGLDWDDRLPEILSLSQIRCTN